MKKIKKVHYLIGITVILAAGNIWIWFLSRSYEPELVWIGFILGWFNLLMTWVTAKRNPTVSYLFLATAILIELLLLINIFWIAKRLT